MAAVALIEFQQGLNTAPGGTALLGTLDDGAVEIRNDDNTDIVSWSIELLDVPPESALATGVLASGSISAPFATFTPDVPNAYRVRLTVFGVGGERDVDIRCFAIPMPGRRLIIPPYQKLPDPLPLPGEAANAKPDEMNFNSSTRGWAGGNSGAKLLHRALTELNNTLGVPPFTSAADSDVLTVRQYPYNEPIGSVWDTNSAWIVNSNGAGGGVPSMIEVDIEQNIPLRRVVFGGASTSLHGGAIFNGSLVALATTSGNSGILGYDRDTEQQTIDFNLDASAGRALATGLGSLWALTATNLIKVTSGLTAQTLALSGGVDVLVDPTNAHYPDNQPRVWVANANLSRVQRVELGGLTVDASVLLSSLTIRAIALSPSAIYVVGSDAGTTANTIHRISFEPVAVTQTSIAINTVFPLLGGATVLDLEYYPESNQLVVYGKLSGSTYVALVNATTLNVVNSYMCAATDPDPNSRRPRMCRVKDDYWLPVCSVAPNGRMVRFDAGLGNVLTSPPVLRSLVYAAGGGGGGSGPDPAVNQPTAVGTSTDIGDDYQYALSNHTHNLGPQFTYAILDNVDENAPNNLITNPDGTLDFYSTKNGGHHFFVGSVPAGEVIGGDGSTLEMRAAFNSGTSAKFRLGITGEVELIAGTAGAGDVRLSAAANRSIYLQEAGVDVLEFDVDADGATIMRFASGTTVTLNQAQAVSGAGKALSITAQAGAVGSIGGHLQLGGGAAGTPGSQKSGDTRINLGTTVSGVSAEFSLWSGATQTFNTREVAGPTIMLESGPANAPTRSIGIRGVNASMESSGGNVALIPATELYMAHSTAYGASLNAGGVRYRQWRIGIQMTSDATPTVKAIFAPGNNKIGYGRLTITGYSIAGDWLMVEYQVAITTNGAGAVTVRAKTGAILSQSGAWAADAVASGTSIAMTVTGAAATLVDWHGILEWTE